MSFLSVNVIYSFIQKGKWYSNSTKVLPFHFHFALLSFQLFSTQNLVMNLAVPNCSTKNINMDTYFKILIVGLHILFVLNTHVKFLTNH